METLGYSQCSRLRPTHAALVVNFLFVFVFVLFETNTETEVCVRERHFHW